MVVIVVVVVVVVVAVVVVAVVVVVVVVAGVVVVVVGASVIFDATFLWLSGRVFIDNYSALRKATAGVSRVGFRCFFSDDT